MKFKKTENERRKHFSWEYAENYRKGNLKQCYVVFLHGNREICAQPVYVHTVKTMCLKPLRLQNKINQSRLHRMVCCHDSPPPTQTSGKRTKDILQCDKGHKKLKQNEINKIEFREIA